MRRRRPKVDAKEYAALLASWGEFEPRYMVKFDDLTVGVFPFGPDEVDDIRSYPGVECVLRLTPGTYIELDPRSLDFTIV